MENLYPILSIVFAVLTVVGTFVAYYFKAKNTIIAAANGAINNAEDSGKPGNEKFEMAVDELYALIPAAVKPFISREFIGTLTQKAFDEIDKFAKKQADKEITEGANAE